ncbi:hypothetical protein KDC22_13785 [Paenibacillus tritici]|uniref:hypothetical protein n=1 Tax=Paenibacillus tritici TaxID=1873425 RepID=UPI001BA6C299|nr:hypothetical protein [Paenibacillus tritici]QUL57444.1 hypothetical protein KDC22_13785 [Paenibacillus tritici]
MLLSFFEKRCAFPNIAYFFPLEGYIYFMHEPGGRRETMGRGVDGFCPLAEVRMTTGGGAVGKTALNYSQFTQKGRNPQQQMLFFHLLTPNRRKRLN